MHPSRTTFAIPALVFVLAIAFSCAQMTKEPSSTDRVTANDNRRPAGRLRGDTLEITLVARAARWFPEADSGPHLDVTAFAAQGRAPEIPSPLIRVRTGTTIRATVRNELADSTLKVFGLFTRPSAALDSIILAPGESRTLTFAAGAPGTYVYGAKVGTIDWAMRERETMVGAFVVDSLGDQPNDRVFVVNIWGEPIDSVRYRNALAINGRAWPYTERFAVATGDTLRWRWVNGSVRPHPMHLHGFYFTVNARGTLLADTAIAPGERAVVVTNVLNPFETRSFTWSPDREGNWLFHCHIGFHVVPEARLTPSSAHATLSEDAGEHMAGLVLGIVVKQRGRRALLPDVPPRRLDLFVNEGEKRGRAPRAMGYAFSGDSLGIPGPLLTLTRGEPTEIAVHNRLSQPTAVHWHGIELESYSDGVAGWSGLDKRIAPMVAPKGSFVARLTLPRAGTFIYHTHLGDLEQLTSGLYGPLVVLEPGQRFDPSTDHVIVGGWDGLEHPNFLINGDSVPQATQLAAGVVHRLRFINIGAAEWFRVRLTRDTSLATWRALARDGFDIRQPREQLAEMEVDVGQTADFAFAPPAPGEYRMTITSPLLAKPHVRRIDVR